MKYISTRGKATERVDAAYAIKTGLASDGGLFMPESIPELNESEIKLMINESYPQRVARILSAFLTDYTYEELLSDAEAAYSSDKFGAHPAPVSKLNGNNYMLELWHGPTCAFKDMALQIMPRLFTRALRKCGEQRCALILVATSGDTGKAALEGYRDVEGTKIKVFYPSDGVSRVQKLQMQTQEGSNVSVSAIIGNFDDAQNGVKKIFSDKEIAKKLDSAGVFLSSANSINWGRLVPQIVYYVSAYCDMVKSGTISFGEKIDVCVPTGNFGNIFAAFIAKLMGLPIEKLVCASNVNNVLTDFLKTGTYDKNRNFFATISPSMDILISSNLERLLYVTLGSEKTAEYMEKLSKYGSYTLAENELALIQKHFIGYYTDENQTQATISDTYKNKNCLIDTHTAVAVNAANRYAKDSKAERKILAVSTASPFKFARDVYISISGCEPANELSALSELSELTGVKAPLPLCNLLEKNIVHSEIIDKSEMENATFTFAKA
ncbi:MAG: threonine synthase [Ruminococcaceae bacterium]|nr:threonine synthase [Oscillospiraceae bacterium]